jgi:hypothetical protein
MHTWVERLHNTSYISKNIHISHFIPSLMKNTWWILINPSQKIYKNQIQKNILWEIRRQWFPSFSTEVYKKKWVSLFCYHKTFESIKNELLKYQDTLFFVFDHQYKWENIIQMPFLSLEEYYKFLYVCDQNIVRWENSFMESLWTWKPFLWDIYKESNEAHKEKIHDFSMYLTSHFWNIFWEYIQIYKDFNLWKEKEALWQFLHYENNFEIITKETLIEKDVITNIWYLFWDSSL